MKKRNNSNITVEDMIINMSEGNPGAMTILMNMMQNHKGFMDILLCDSLEIKGSKLYMLNNDCCNRNNDKFNRTLNMFRCGVFNQEQIHENLELVRAIPFIDDSIIIEGVPEYGKDFGPEDEKWKEFCSIQKEAFTKKLNILLETQQNKGKLKK